MTAPAAGAWPLSAAATAVLRDPGLSGSAVLKLALRELVVRDVLRVEEFERRRFRGPRLVLRPGRTAPAGLPVPLPRLAQALLPAVPPDGGDAAAVVRGAVQGRPGAVVAVPHGDVDGDTLDAVLGDVGTGLGGAVDGGSGGGGADGDGGGGGGD